MPKRDSIDKLVTSYFAAITATPFTYKRKTYLPQQLVVSPGIFRGYTCPAGCGGCCPRFTLDYMVTEVLPDQVGRHQLRTVEFNSRNVTIISDTQEDDDAHHCGNLDMETGRCGIHGRQPFTCDFELIRFSLSSSPERPHRATQRLFGRGWQMLRVDGERGALCAMTDVTDETVADAYRRMERLRAWANYFHLEHRLDPVLEWMATGPHDEACVV